MTAKNVILRYAPSLHNLPPAHYLLSLPLSHLLLCHYPISPHQSSHKTSLSYILTKLKFSTFDFPFTLTTLPIAHATLETIQVHEYYIEELHNLVYYGLKDLARKNATLNNTVLKKVKAPTSKYVFEDPHVNASAKKSDAKGVKGGKVAKAGKGKAKVGGKGGEEDDEKPIPKGAIRKWGREMGNLMKKIEGWEGEFEELGGMVRGEMEACNGRVWKKVGGAWRSVKP